MLPGLRRHQKLYLHLILIFLICRAMFIRRNIRRCIYVLFMAETIRGHREQLISSLAFRAALPLPTRYCCRLSVDVCVLLLPSRVSMWLLPPLQLLSRLLLPPLPTLSGCFCCRRCRRVDFLIYVVHRTRLCFMLHQGNIPNL